MDWSRARGLLRFDSGGWRRFAELGCVYGPEWWKRASPPVIAAIIYVIGKRQREAVRRTQRPIYGPQPWWREHWNTYRVFAEFARSVTEGLEQWGPHPKPLALSVSGRDRLEAALAEGRGVVLVTGHFGSWEVGARGLRDLGRPVTLVMARELNATAHRFTHDLRTRHGVRVIYSDESVFSGLSILQALRRGEVVCMQIEPWGPKQGSQDIDMFGHHARFQLGPFVVSRVARAPLFSVFSLRTGIRRYELVVGERQDPRTPAATLAAFQATIRAYEDLIRAHPQQWLMFQDVWRDGAPTADTSPPPAMARVSRARH
jgi:KDO2-lipid IV(A) lauroyltransferase